MSIKHVDSRMQEWKWHKQLLLTLLKHIILCRESVAQKKTFPLIFKQMLFPSYLQTNALIIYLDFQSTKQTLWLVDSWSCAPDQIQMYPDWEKIAQLLLMCLVQQHAFAICLRENTKYITKHLIYGPLGNWLACFAWCFPQLPLGKHHDFRKNKTKCFPQYYTLSLCCLWGE